MEEKLSNKYLIIIGSLITITLLIIVGYGFLNTPGFQSKGLNIKPVTIQWEILQLPQLSQLSDFPRTSYPTQSMGRDNPLIMEKEGTIQSSK